MRCAPALSSSPDTADLSSLSAPRIKMRNQLSEVYFGKTKDVIAELRSVEGAEMRSREANLRNELMGAFKRRAA